MERLRVATYNVHKCAGMDGRVSPRRIADVIRALDAHAIGLQEIVAPHAQEIADLLGMHLVLGEVRRINGAGYGNAVLSRYEMTGVCTYDLTAPGRERRGCVRTDVHLPGGDVLHLFNFHLGTDFGERRWQARRIVETELIRSKDLRGPRVILGDFNEWTRGMVSIMFAAEMKGVNMATYPGVWPVLRLDHIYYDDDLALERAMLVRNARTLIASDHLPLVADFRVLPAPGQGRR
jgi:endonuclease/exonuclease/phosphatase family metal-dependent hydrolase